MALLQVNFHSQALQRSVPMNVILPTDRATAIPKNGYKTLYLLHGLFGNYAGWVNNTRIQQWAEEKNIAVVMPSGDNSFYIDWQQPNNDYSRFIGQELVDLTRKMFPLSTRREDTFIAGLSMGGYGALYNGLKYNTTFSHIAALSSAVHLFEVPEDMPVPSLIGENWVFGDMKIARKTDKNPRIALANLKKAGAPIPRIYMACGLQDSLLLANQALRDYFKNEGVDLTYEESEGIHDWIFWDTYIRKVLDWLPLEETK